MDITISSVFETFKRKRCIVINGFKLTESNVLRDKSVRFRCCNKKCSASVVVDSACQRVIETNGTVHNHDAYTTEEIAAQTVKVSLKRKASENMKEKPSSMIRRELNKNEGANSGIVNSELPLMRKVIYRSRNKRRLFKKPKNLQESCEVLFENQSNILSSNEKFCHVDEDKSIILFTCAANLLLLSTCASLFGDGTFSYAPSFCVINV